MVLVFKTREALRSVIKHQGKVGADIGATMVFYGIGAEAATTSNLGADIIGFAVSNVGAYIGGSIEGAVLVTRRDLNEAVYGTGATPEGIIAGKWKTGIAQPLSLLVAGLCRLLHRRGKNVAPFKPQNMSNNAAVTSDGGEIGRAQALQARACALVPSVHMNPVLLKPQTDIGAQIVVQGRVTGNAQARDFHALKPKLLAAVLESFKIIGTNRDIVLVEGAGSPAEINLRAGDIANMGFAESANVPVVIVADIDRGGVIASLVGTHAVLTEMEQKRVAGFIINKFRGDISLFDDGVKMITDRTGWSCLGIVPHFNHANRLPAEDAMSLDRLSAEGQNKIYPKICSSALFSYRQL